MKEHELPSHWKAMIERRVLERSGGRFRTLGAADFPPGQVVELRFPDGSAATFRYAFAFVDEQREELGVFTEHCGHHIFPLGNLQYKLHTAE